MFKQRANQGIDHAFQWLSWWNNNNSCLQATVSKPDIFDCYNIFIVIYLDLDCVSLTVTSLAWPFLDQTCTCFPPRDVFAFCDDFKTLYGTVLYYARIKRSYRRYSVQITKKVILSVTFILLSLLRDVQVQWRPNNYLLVLSWQENH